MKKIGLFTTLLTTATLLTGCNVNVNIQNTPENNILQGMNPTANIISGQFGSQDITGDSTIYKNNQYGISLNLGEAYKGGFVHQEDGDDFSTLTFFIPDETATKEETHIDGYRDVVTIYMVSTDKNDDFKDYSSGKNIEDLGYNNKYYFYEEKNELIYKGDFNTDNLIFSI